MSKKMLKRSLALGALMAFVITGSAFAAVGDDFRNEYPTKYPGSSYGESPYVSSETGATVIEVIHDDEFDSWDDFKDKPFGLKEHYYPGEQTLDEDVTLKSNVGFTGYIDHTDNPDLNVNSSYLKTDLNGNKLTIDYQGGVYALSSQGHVSGINYIFTENVGSDYGYVYNHIYTNLNDFKLDLPGFNIYDSNGGGDLEINSSSVAVFGYGEINVDGLKITSTNSNGIQSMIQSNNVTGEHKMEIYANSMVVEAKYNPIQAYITLEMGSANKPIETLNIQGVDGADYLSPITAVGGVKIFANELNVAANNNDGIIACLDGSIEIQAEKGNINSNIFAGGYYGDEDGSKGVVDLTLGSGVTLTGKIITDVNEKTGHKESSATVDLSGTWNLTEASSLTNATFRKGSTLVIEGEKYVYDSKEGTVNTYALNGVGDKATLTVENGAKLTVTGIDKNIYNIAKGFATLEGTKVDENTTKYWDVSNLNTLMEGKWLEDTENKTLQLEVVAKDAEQMATDTGMSTSTAGLVQSIIENADNAKTPAEEAAVEFIEKVQANNSAPEAVGNAINNATKMGEAGGNSATAASIVKNVTGVTNDRLSFNCGHSAPHKGGHGVGLFEEGSGADIWVEYVHGKDEVEDMPSTAGASSYEGQYNGLVMGVDFKKVNKFQSGIAFNYGEGDTNSVGNAVRTHSDYDFWGVGYYGSIHNDDSNVIFDISYAQTDSDVTQNNSTTVLEANPETTTWSAGVKLEKLYQNENVQIVPYTGLRYMSIDADDYSTRNGEFYYSMDRQDIWLLPLGVSIRQEIANDNGWTVSPRVDLSYIWAFGDTNSNMEVKSPFAGVSQLGYDVMDDGSFLGLVGIEAHKGQWGYGVAYSYQKGDHSESKKWYVDVNYSF